MCCQELVRMCSPPQVMSKIEQQGEEAAWLKEHKCLNLCDKALTNLHTNKDLSSVLPIRSEFTCDNTATSDAKGIVLSITIGGSQVFASVKHLRESKGLESSGSQILRQQRPKFFAITLAIVGVFVSICIGLLGFLVFEAFSKCYFLDKAVCGLLCFVMFTF